MFTPMMIALFLTFNPIQADSSIIVSGTVVDMATDSTITSAKLTFQEIEATITLDENGTFKVEGAPAGVHTIVIEAEGYVTKTITVDVTESVDLNIELEKAKQEEDPN